MPFQPGKPGKEAYVLDEDVLIDSEVDRQDGETNTDFTVTLPKVINNVIAAEVSEVEINRATIGAFSLEKWIDVTIWMDPLDGSDPTPFTFSAEIPPLDGTSTPTEMASIVALAMNNAVRAAFTDGNWLDYTGQSSTASFSTITLSCFYEEAGPGIPENANAAQTLGFAAGHRSFKMDLNFGTGPHADESIARIIGFTPGVDVEVFALITGGGIFATYYFEFPGTERVLTTPYPYLDIFIDEMPEFQPFFRFYPPNTTYTRRQLLPGRSRILSNPIRRLDKLRVRIRHQGGITPLATYPIFFHLRIFHIVEGDNVPQYLTERIVIR